MNRQKKRQFTESFKSDAVQMCKTGTQSIGAVARELKLTESALRKWVKRDEIDSSRSPAISLTTVEREELGELRRRVKRLEMEREILRKAAAFFAKESA